MTFQDLIIIWVLIFARISAAFITLPIFRSRNMPMKVKIIFISLFSYLFLVSGSFNYSMQPYDFIFLLKGITFEMLNGMVIGFSVLLVMNAIYVAGQLIDMNIGFSMVNVMSAQDESSLPITANVYYVLMLIIFISIDAHHYVIDAISHSFNHVALGSLGFNITHVAAYTELMAMTLEIGFRIAIPVIFTILVSNVILGLLSKAMPGMNVFMIGMPFKILVGLATILLVLPSTYNIMLEMLSTLVDFMEGVVGRMYL